MKLVVLSDIHANFLALKSVFNDLEDRGLSQYKLIFLGDTINYGLRPNETLEFIKQQKNIEVLLSGNHEMALFGVEDDRFSSPRGKEILDLTKEIISSENINYIDKSFSKSFIEKEIDGKKYLFIHGSLVDKYWGTIKPSNVEDDIYKKYDVVFSGHSHMPHFVEVFFDDDNKKRRNKKRTIFINPGSVGQPRNHSNQAQYVIFDTIDKEVSFCKSAYKITEEQDIYQQYNVDKFYSQRLGEGI